MVSVLITIYTAALILSVVYKKFIFACILLTVGVISVFAFQSMKKIKKQNIKKLIQTGAEKHFINVNKEDWYILEEIPHIPRVKAKKAVFIRTKAGKFNSVEDFIKKVGFEENEIQDVLDVIKV